MMRTRKDRIFAYLYIDITIVHEYREKSKKMRICKKTILLYNTLKFMVLYVYKRHNSLFITRITMAILSTLLSILAILIIIVVMVQAKGSGLSIVPGSGDFGKFERRGGELIIHRITIGLIALFVITSVIAYFIA